MTYSTFLRLLTDISPPIFVVIVVALVFIGIEVSRIHSNTPR